MSLLQEISETVGGVAERVGPAVVGLGRGWGVGSGVVVEDGTVLTSAHAVRGEEPTVTFADGRRATGRLAGVDPDLDVAVIAVDTGDVAPVAWAPDAAAVLGAPVVALANPGGRGLRATLGFVSAGERRFRGPRGRRISGAIEHTAPLPRGSSGGPLLDAEGRLLGINAVRLEGGLILALPAGPALRERIESLARGEAPAGRRLGVAVAPPRVARRLRRAVGLPERDGLLVRAVEPDSPAARAGLERGDLIVAAAGAEVDGIDALHAALDAVPAGGTLPLTALRGTDERAFEVAFDEAA
jgi:serine protease Do